jgi:heat shock protein HtpX
MYENISNINYLKQKVMNLLQSAALLIGMVSVLSLLGWIFAGANGMLWAFFVSIGILMISPNLSPRLILGLYSAKPLSPNRATGRVLGWRKVEHYGYP